MVKKIVLKTINVISVILILISVIVLLSVVLTKKGEVPRIFGFSLFRVMTGSMEPQIPTDALILVKETEASELQVGDVISFFSRDPMLLGQVNTHRITSIEWVEGKRLIHTKGDANNVEDGYPAYEEDLVGRVIYTSSFLGKGIRLLSNPLIFFPLIIVPLVIVVINSLRESIRVAGELARQEEEEAVREAIETIRRKREAEKQQYPEEDFGQQREAEKQQYPKEDFGQQREAEKQQYPEGDFSQQREAEKQQYPKEDFGQQREAEKQQYPEGDFGQQREAEERKDPDKEIRSMQENEPEMAQNIGK